MSEEKIEESLRCVLTTEFFAEPVRMPCCTKPIEKEAIHRWIDGTEDEPAHNTCPLCRADITKETLTDHTEKAADVVAYLKNNPTEKEQQYCPITFVITEIKKGEDCDIQALIEYVAHYGKDPLNAALDKGNTLLHLAAFYGNTALVKELIDRGADQTAINENGDTILHSAVRSGNTELVIDLLSGNADQKAKNRYGNTLLHYYT